MESLSQRNHRARPVVVVIPNSTAWGRHRRLPSNISSGGLSLRSLCPSGLHQCVTNSTGEDSSGHL